MPSKSSNTPNPLKRLRLLGCAAIIACAPAQAPAGERVWRFTHAIAAPWGPALPGGAQLSGRTVTLGDASLRGPEPLRCETARIEATRLPAEGLFEGNLPAPATDSAKTLGLAGFPVDGIRVSCDNAGFEFHRADADTLLLGLDNRVWILSGAPGTTAAADSPAGVVQRLLELHFNGDMGFTPASAAAKAALLSAGLANDINAYFSRPLAEDQVPDINGDPFTASQEYPTRFAVGAAEIALENRAAQVPVRYADDWREYSVQFLLLHSDAGWRVDDVVDGSGTGLRSLLRRETP
ncbi:hypothetical protein NP590_01205 [Methylomonas sp. SURF-2]|uniref:DUF3828 domain-containing protein n=1 Tax=Methylomonas subterranea TaxID=2952225 RepID=A0ABT1TBT4_9GAMM|nr:hypothetical protein [Methylomonas sp. SURF-2]MCQ8102706.1 hypothetical protein [Methylomonas sp. SURF-2]